MAANDAILGVAQFVAESAQGAQTPIINGLPIVGLNSTTVPVFVMFPEAYRYFQPAQGTAVYAARKVVIPQQGYLLVKVRPTVGSKTLDSTGSTSGFVRLTVLEKDTSIAGAEPVTRVITEADRNTTRIPDDPAWDSSTSKFQEAYAFNPGNGRVWLFAGPQNADFRTTA